MTPPLIGARLLATLLAWAIVVFNRLVRLRNQVRTAWADIDVQLIRRHEAQLQYARRFHNGARRDLNDALQRVPDMFVARLAGISTAGFSLVEDGSRRSVPVEWAC